jgi:hypothetical protein
LVPAQDLPALLRTGQTTSVFQSFGSG